MAEGLHVVLFPFLARGHIPAFLRLGVLLQELRPGITVTLVSTQGLLGSISLPAPIGINALPFAPADHGLPPGAESIADLQVHQFITFFQASESLRAAFDGFLSGIRPPVCVVADQFFAWTADVARARGAFHAVFLPGGAFGNAVFFSVWKHLPHTLTNSDEFPLPDFPGVVLHRTQLPRLMLTATGADPWTAFFRRLISSFRNTNAILVNTVQDLESSGLNMLRRSFGVQPWPIGPILAVPDPSGRQDDAGIIQWLDARSLRSVLYISFGSQNSVTGEQMTELALGLEASGRPFLWVVRPPLGHDATDGFKPEWLPAGFEERTADGGRGLLVRRWAPQARILEHPSTGAFMSHCGWNSILESLCHGVPVIAWPLGAEQFFNAMVLAEWGVCLEMARGGVVESSAVAEAVGTAMGETEKGDAMRKNAGVIARAMAAALERWRGSSAVSLEGFLRSVETSISIHGSMDRSTN